MLLAFIVPLLYRRLLGDEPEVRFIPMLIAWGVAGRSIAVEDAADAAPSSVGVVA